MTQTATTTRNKIIGDAFADYEVNRKTITRLCTAEDYVNEALREHGHPTISGSELMACARNDRRRAISKACSEFASNAIRIVCSQREYCNQVLREIGQPEITSDEVREFDVRV